MENSQMLRNAINDTSKLWESWNLRLCIILSLALQAFLLLIAPKRQRSKSSALHLLIWFGFLLADWIAAYALCQTVQIPSLLLDPQGNAQVSLFWAQFLLLHLAGPDNTISLTLGDAGVWTKQAFVLYFQVIFTFESLYMMALIERNNILLPTRLVFVMGFIKCVEKFQLLLRLDRWREILLPKPNPGLDYEQAMEMYLSTDRAQVQMHIDMMMVPVNIELNTEVGLLVVADFLFRKFKVLFAGSSVSADDKQLSRSVFLKIDHTTAFRLIDYELSFLNELLLTKAFMLQNIVGYLWRFITCFPFILGASVSFFLVEKNYDRFDIYLTYVLLGATLLMEITSATMLIFTERSFIKLSCMTWIKSLISPIIWKRKRRWSGKVLCYNMITYCTTGGYMSRLLYKFTTIYLQPFADKMKAVRGSYSQEVTSDLEEYIFSYLQKKSEEASNLKVESVPLKRSVDEFGFVESILLWHLTTELCFYSHQQQQNDGDDSSSKRNCKLLSDYMFYLLLLKPEMISPDLGDWYIAFQDTQEEARRFFRKHLISNHEKGCEKLISVKPVVRPGVVKGGRSKSVLFDAVILAQELQDVEDKWEVMSHVWMELMFYAAISCRPIIHAQQPSNGGELLTFVWLLMNHFGWEHL